MATWKKVIVSGSNAVLNQITASGINAPSITGSLEGTASYALFALTASYVSGAIQGDSVSASWASSSVSSSYSDYAVTASYVETSQTASYISGSNVDGTVSSSFTASYSSFAVSASYAVSFSYVTTSTQESASWASQSFSASYAETSSYAVTSSYTYITQSSVASASWASQSVSASYAETASYFSSSFFNTQGTTTTVSGTLVVSGSSIVTGSQTVIGNSTISGSQTITGSSTISGSSVVTGSQTIVGNSTISGSQTVSGSLTVTQGLTSSLDGTASWAVNALTASYLVGGIESSSFASSSLTASRVSNDLAFGAGLSVGAFNGSATVTASVSGAAQLTSNKIVKWVSGSHFGDTGITENGLGGVTIAGDITAQGDLTVNKNLIVQGTASFQNTQNLNVADQFILLSSGSTTYQDSGIIVASASNGVASVVGTALYLETTTDGSNGRWAVATGVSASATAAAADEYVATTKISTGSVQPVAAPTFGGTTGGIGNFFINADGEIFIYA